MSKHDEITGILTPAEIDACTNAAAARARAISPIVHAVAQASGIPASQIYSRSRKAHVNRARQIVMLAAHERGMSLSEIGRALGRDHTTIDHGIKAEKARRASDG